MTHIARETPKAWCRQMNHVVGLRCVNCGREYATTQVEYYCQDCGYNEGILDVLYDYDAVEEELNPSIMAQKTDRSMWRYLPVLPIDEPELVPPLQVGWTPLYEAPRLAEALGIARCWVKDEGRNPTASFKDRASAVGVAKALERKAPRIACASTGNAASSLAGMAAAAELPATIFVPRRAPEAKVAQLLVYGAQVFSVDGTYDEAWELCMQAAAEFGWYNRNCAINPYLIEGKKTFALELAEQFMSVSPGEFPEWVVVSVGDGCTIGGIWKGLREMHRLGFLPRLPKVLGVQAEGSKPFLTAWQSGGGLVPSEGSTLADSIAVGHPRNFRKGMRAVTESGGAFVAVPDEDILASITMLARTAGVFGEPAGAAGVAGVKQAVAMGIIDAGETAVIAVTGNGLKDVHSAIRAAGRPVLTRPDIEEIRRSI